MQQQLQSESAIGLIGFSSFDSKADYLGLGELREKSESVMLVSEVKKL
jgi:hypothetical protein